MLNGNLFVGWPAVTVFTRTLDPVPGFAETQAGDLVCMAISYENVGNARIRIYRNDTLIGDYVRGPLLSYSGSTTEILFGIRHTIGNTAIGTLDARIEEARLYDGVLTPAQIAQINQQVVNHTPPVPTLSQWGLILLGLVVVSMGVIVVWRKGLESGKEAVETGEA